MSFPMAAMRAHHKQKIANKNLARLKWELTPINSVRCTTPTLRRFLLDTSDPYYWDGKPYDVCKKSLGAGVYEVSLVLKGKAK